MPTLTYSYQDAAAQHSTTNHYKKSYAIGDKFQGNLGKLRITEKEKIFDHREIGKPIFVLLFSS